MVVKRSFGMRLPTRVIALAVGLLTASAVAGCGASRPSSTSLHATTCGVPYTFTVGGHAVSSGSCAGVFVRRPPTVTVRLGERFSLLVTGNRNGARVTRAFPVPKPRSSSVVITGVNGQTVRYQAKTAGRSQLMVRSEFCPTDPKVSTCSVLTVSVR